MNPIGTRPPLENAESARTMDTPAATAQDSTGTASANRPSNTDPSLFGAQSSQGPVPCATPAPRPRLNVYPGAVAAATQKQFPSPDEAAVNINLQDIINLVREHTNRLHHEYYNSFFIDKDLNRKKYSALESLETDLNAIISPTYGDLSLLLNRIQKTANDENVVKEGLFGSKTKSMLFVILKKIQEKIAIHDKTRENYKKNTHKDTKKITTLPTDRQRQILDYLGAEDLPATFSTSRTFRSARPLLKVNYWKEKLIWEGLDEIFFKQIPDSVKFEVLYAKIKHLTCETKTELEFWMFAFLSGDEGLIQTAMASNPDLQKTTSSGMNALHFAAMGGNESLVKFLLETARIRLDSKDKNGKDILHFATLSGNIGLLDYLRKKPNHRWLYSSKDKDIVQLAAEDGKLDLVQYIVKNAFLSIDTTYNNKKNILHCSAKGGNLDLVKYAINTLKISIDSKDDQEKNVLHYAAESGNVDLIKYILNNSNIKIDSKDNQGKNILHYAAEGGHVALIKYILNNSNIQIDSTDNKGKNILHCAAEGGHVALIKYILNNSNIQIDSIDKEGKNVLHYAAKGGHLALIKYILNNFKIPIDSTDKGGNNVLHFAAIGGHISTIRYLLQVHNLDPALQNKSGKSAFAVAKKRPWEGGPLPEVHAVLRNQEDTKNILENPQTLLTLPLVCQKEILGYLSVKNAQFALSTCKVLQDAKPDLRITSWKEKFVSLGVPEHLARQLPDYIKFDILYQKIQLINPTWKTELWELAFLSGDERFIQKAMDLSPNLQKELSLNKKNALNFAAWGGNMKAVEQVFKNSTIAIHDGWWQRITRNPLHYAAWGGNVTVFEYIRTNLNIPFDIKDDDDANVLHFAAKGGHLEMLEHIYTTSNILFDSRDKYGNNVALIAAFNGYLEIFTYIFHNSKTLLDSTNRNGLNVLHAAAFGGHIHLLKYILANTDIPFDSTDNQGNNALHLAAWSGQVTIIYFLRKVYNLECFLQNKLGIHAYNAAEQLLKGDKLKRTLEALCISIRKIPDSAFL